MNGLVCVEIDRWIIKRMFKAEHDVIFLICRTCLQDEGG